MHEVNRTVSGVINGGLTLCASAVTIALITGAVVVVDPLVALAAAVSLGLSYALIHALVRRRLVRNGTITTHIGRPARKSWRRASPRSRTSSCTAHRRH